MSSKPDSTKDGGKNARSHPSRELEFEQVQNAVRGIRFGEVRVIIQDGVIVQIERVERQRLC